jgi:predicted nuclease of predicted toxin-antitoxin system
MGMRVKVDEDLPRATVQMLRDRGYEAASVMEQGMGGWKDPALWQAVQSEQQFLVTADKGFADIRFYPPGSHAGVLLLRPDEDGIRPIVELLERVLANYGLEALARTVTVVTPRGIRIRRAGT